jgi:DNA N-6-adenine-methyltransferase (Dam)
MDMVIRTATLRRDEPRQDIAVIIIDIQSCLDTADRIEERHPLIDVKAQRIRCEAAMRYFENAQAIKAECAARGITIKQMFGCGERHLRKLRQLWRRWGEYETLREAYAGQGYGIKLAFRLVGIPVDSGDGPSGHQGAGHDDQDTKGEWRTPKWFFDPIHAAIRFSVDLAATKDSALLPRWFEDSLPQPWDGEVGWLNAPFTRGLLPRFVEKCVHGNARIVVALLPAAMNVGWFHQLVLPHAALLLPDKRLGFGSDANTWMHTHSSPFNVMLAVFGDIDEVLAKLDPYISNRTMCASLSIPREPLVEARRPALQLVTPS